MKGYREFSIHLKTKKGFLEFRLVVDCAVDLHAAHDAFYIAAGLGDGDVFDEFIEFKIF